MSIVALWATCLEQVAKATQGSSMRGNFMLFPSSGLLLSKIYLNGNQFENKFEYMLHKNKDFNIYCLSDVLLMTFARALYVHFVNYKAARL